MRRLLVAGLLLLPCQAAVVRQVIVARSVDEQSCAVPKSSESFESGSREAFAWFDISRATAEEVLKIEWLAPGDSVSLTAEYRDLPGATRLCLVTRLPIAGFEAANQPGKWTVRIRSGDRTLASREFRIAAGPTTGLRVTSVQKRAVQNGVELVLAGAGFGIESLVHIAQYTRGGGWRYISVAQPKSVTSAEMVVEQGPLDPAEYLVIVRNPGNVLSAPMPFVVSTSGYKLPTVAGEPWVITQAPYGAFSHWGRTLHAYDIAPRGGRCIVAMKAGTAHVHDVGARQDHLHRTFGNYVTIDHGDGEYSHYAHLATGTFVVSEGQHVEQGQALAIVGNSGYTLGEGGGYHVHVQVTHAPAISSPSVPFQFEELNGTPRGQLTVASTNASPLCDCSRRQPFVAGAAAAPLPAAHPEPPKQFNGALSVGMWWNDAIEVPRRAQTLDAVLTWEAPESDLDLHLVSPSGHHYGWYADTTGYSGRIKPQRFQIPHPEPGVWRVSVQAVRGATGQIEFSINSNGRRLTPLTSGE
ncbi:MAG TPA: peptidoglycan DD-metalloendopeptidase family protein [Bryobacteraceae bacterium]|nr:peptidoglycan DD-metalloendopeptidase family protein [Bryobacteraceae bacterium]